MGNFFEKEKIEKLNTYSKNTIALYLNFWGYSDVEFDGEASNAEPFLALCRNVASKGSAYHLVVCKQWRKREGNIIYISLSQLIYDLDVFYTLPAEIHSVIKKDRFADFAFHSFGRMNKNGWEIGFSNDGIYCDIFSSTYPVNFVDENYIPKSKRLFVINCWDEELTQRYFEKLKNSYYIETHRALALLREWIIFELCSYYEKLLGEKGVKLYLVNWEWAQNNYLYPKKDITAAEKERRAKKYSIVSISGNEEKYSDFLKDFYGDDYSLGYVRNVMSIPLRNYYGVGCIHHADYSSEYLNVSLGERKTTDSPTEYSNTVYMLGGCVFFGYAIDDSKTISSFLQRKINHELDKKIRVSNHAVWGGNIDETYNSFYELEFRKGDIVIISYAGKIPIGEYDISKVLSSHRTDSEFYYEGIVHCNGEAYCEVANGIYSMIESDLKSTPVDSSQFRLKRNKENIVQDLQYLKYTEEYISSISEGLPPLFEEGKTYGCAVMNCNPFTLGHRYLIETSAQQVDYFIIFVVEENKSYFSFNDRIKLVKEGVNDLDNVYVVPSGKLIISAVTFPGYFLKDNPNESVADSSRDIEIFGRYIAPALGITKRFVGSEPKDIVTNHYNETMQRLLPQFDIDLCIVERKKNENEVISASTVRKMLEEKKIEKLKSFVPSSTYQYLIKRFGLNGEKNE